MRHKEKTITKRRALPKQQNKTKNEKCFQPRRKRRVTSLDRLGKKKEKNIYVE
jgi:hypothetical protein